MDWRGGVEIAGSRQSLLFGPVHSGESTETERESSDRSSQGSPINNQQTQQGSGHRLGDLWVHSSAAALSNPRDQASRQDQSSETGRIRIGRPPKKRDSSELGDPAPKPRRPRKASHLARREEKESLVSQIAQMETAVELMKRRILSKDESHTLAEAQVANDILRDTVYSQETTLASLQAMLSKRTRETMISPIESVIELTADRAERRASLRGMRAKKLRNAQRFIELRCYLYSPSSPIVEFQQFETSAGDFCSVHCSREHCEDAQSVKQVFDLLLFSFRHIEINISARLGHLTIREDDDSGGDNIFQNRLVSMTHMGIAMESNSVLFSGYFENDPDHEDVGEFGIVALECVAKDDLYPYRPKERVRRDTTVIIQIKSFLKTVTDADGQTRQEPAVVITRWHMAKVYRPQMPVSGAVWSEIKVCMERWREAMRLNARETLNIRA